MKNDSFGLLVLKALSFFIENPYEETYLREFSRKLKISPNTSQRFLDLFLKEGFIKESKKANLRIFKANLDNIVFRQIKRTYSIKDLVGLGVIERLKESASHVVVFGSVAEGLDDRKSDIDLLIISSNKAEVKNGISEIQKKADREIQEYIFSFAEWKKQKKNNPAFYWDVISKGINLIGRIPLV